MKIQKVGIPTQFHHILFLLTSNCVSIKCTHSSDYAKFHALGTSCSLSVDIFVVGDRKEPSEKDFLSNGRDKDHSLKVFFNLLNTWSFRKTPPITAV